MAEARHTHPPVDPERLRAFVGARPPDEWFGARPLLVELERRLRHNPRRTPQTIVLAAPEGGGKSELLRQAALAWNRPQSELTPVHLDLGRSPGWRELIESALRQILVAAGRLDAEALVPSQGSKDLRQACAAAPWRSVARFAAADENSSADAAQFELFLDAVCESPVARPALLLNGVAELETVHAREWLHAIAAAARRAGCSLLIESPADPDGAGIFDLPGVETIALPPLSPEESLALVSAAAAGRGATLESSACLPVCARLGGWPGWLLDWVQCLPFEPIGAASRRVVERAYVALLEDSAWSRRLSARFDAAAAPEWREAALGFVGERGEEGAAFNFKKAMKRLGADADAAALTLSALSRIGMIELAGTRWQGTRHPAFADWANLRLEQSIEASEGAGGSAAGIALLARRLCEPLAPINAEAPRSAAQLLPEILARFDGQSLPEALFNYYDYYEAAGRLDPKRRRDAMLQSRRTLEVPECIGVSGGPSEFQARCYRGGKYLRTAEELWLAVDLSATRALTTPEIERTLEHAERRRRRADAAELRVWIIVGETVSSDGLELLRREKIHCSNLEQLALLHELIDEQSARRRAESARERETQASSPAEIPAAIPRSVIDLKSEPPSAETTTLRLPAREESEYIAALMAEKVAIRADFGATEAGKIKTSVLEGTLNAIEHSLNAEKMIEIQFRLSPETMEVVIENEGPHFDPTAVDPPDPKVKLAAGNKRGWGITLMKKFMDEVEYQPYAGGTRLRLVKRRTQPGAVQKTAGREGKGQL